MYSLFTVVSKSYFNFFTLFFKSLEKNSNLKNIDKIYVSAIDLGDSEKKILNHEKIEIIDINIEDNYSGVHSEGWYNNTKQKTIFLKKILNELNTEKTLIMLDCDTYVMDDFSNVINKTYDLQITKMASGSHISKSGVEISHIACFIVFNNIKKSIEFVDEWIDNIEMLLEQKRGRPHETPAMNLVLQNNKGYYNIESLDENIVCSDLSIYDSTKIIHFKSNGPSSNSPEDNFFRRVMSVKDNRTIKNSLVFFE
jgi:hypothetical protein